jgi:hypothetical protein
MPSKTTNDARNRCLRLANTVRSAGATAAHVLTPETRDALEVAAILLEQTSVARYNKAKKEFNQAHGRFIRRQKVGQ